MSLGLSLLIAILTHFPHTPARACLIQRQQIIANAIEESIRVYPGLDPRVLVAVGFSETHLGCDRNEGGNWGAPIDAAHRHIAGTPLQAARILWRSYEVCGTWEGAARRFRTGLCRPTPVGSAYSRSVLRLSRALEQIVAQQANQQTPIFVPARLP